MVMMGTGLKWLTITVVGSCKHGNELPYSINGGDQRQLLRGGEAFKASLRLNRT